MIYKAITNPHTNITKSKEDSKWRSYCKECINLKYKSFSSACKKYITNYTNRSQTSFNSFLDLVIINIIGTDETTWGKKGALAPSPLGKQILFIYYLQTDKILHAQNGFRLAQLQLWSILLLNSPLLVQ